MAGRTGTDTGAVIVVALVVLSGCNGLVQGGTDGETPGETLTPVPFETPTETATPTPRPGAFDWLVADGRLRMDRLLDRHAGYLSGRSFVLTVTRSTTGGDGSVGTFDRRVAVANATTYRRRVTGSRTDGVEVTYVDSSGVYRRVESPNGSTHVTAVEGRAANARARFALLVASTANLLLVPNETRTTTVERNGTRYLRVFSTRAPDYLSAVYARYDVTDFSATIWVHPDGYVRTVVVEFTLVDGTERVTVTERHAYRDVGATTVERPAWVETIDSPNRPGALATATPEPDGIPDSFWNDTETPGSD